MSPTKDFMPFRSIWSDAERVVEGKRARVLCSMAHVNR